MPDVSSVADALATDLRNPEIGGNYSDLILIGHSMGGLVIKRMIISALSSMPENTAFLDRIRHILLYATPSDGVQLPAVLKINRQAKSIACNEEAINELRSQWINRVHTARRDEAPQQGKRYIPVTAVVGLEDNAVPRASAASYYTDVVTVAGNHSEVCKPESREHTSFQTLKRVVKEAAVAWRPSSQADSATTTAVPASKTGEQSEVAAMTEAVKGDKPSNFSSGWAEAEKGNYEEAFGLFEKAALEGKDSDSRLGSLAFACYHLYGKGWAEGFRRLRQLSTDNPDAAEVFSWLALAYSKTAQWQEAIDCYKKWRNLLPAGSERIRATTRLATALVVAGKGEEALSELRAILLEAQDPPDKAEIYKALGETLLKVRKSEPLLGIACYEKALSLAPADIDLRFALAYKHNDVILPTVSLFHYRQILDEKPHQWAANNAGVDAKALDLPLMSVDYYLIAAEQGNTLAMSNIASLLIDAGFEKLAREQLEKARQQPEVHENVDMQLGSIQKARQNEKKELEKIDEKVRKIIRWRRLEADAIAQSPIDPNTLAGEYRLTDGTVVNMLCQQDGTVLGEAKGPEELMTFSGRIEGALLCFGWKTAPLGSSATLLGGTTPLMGLSLRQPASGTGVLFLRNQQDILSGYRIRSETPLEPIEWSITRTRNASP